MLVKKKRGKKNIAGPAFAFAFVGCHWPPLAVVGHRRSAWLSQACVGLGWPSWACVGLHFEGWWWWGGSVQWWRVDCK